MKTWSPVLETGKYILKRKEETEIITWEKDGRKDPLGEKGRERWKSKLVWSEEREQKDDQEKDTF